MICIIPVNTAITKMSLKMALVADIEILIEREKQKLVKIEDAISVARATEASLTKELQIVRRELESSHAEKLKVEKVLLPLQKQLEQAKKIEEMRVELDERAKYTERCTLYIKEHLPEKDLKGWTSDEIIRKAQRHYLKKIFSEYSDENNLDHDRLEYFPDDGEYILLEKPTDCYGGYEFECCGKTFAKHISMNIWKEVDRYNPECLFLDCDMESWVDDGEFFYYG